MRRKTLLPITIYLSSLHTSLALPSVEPEPAPSQAVYKIGFTVSFHLTHQTIHGFGFSEAFQRSHSILNLDPKPQNEVLDLLFNTTTGAGFSIYRLGLGSSIDSRSDHMNSPQPGPNIPFSWDGQDSGQVWVAQQAARRYGVDMFYADAWSAPGWMKTNGRDDGGGWLCGVRGEGRDNGTLCGSPPVNYVEEYSEYLARYVKAYVEAGIPIRHVGFLNEPNLVKNYATMQSTGYQAADIIPSLSRALSKLNLTIPTPHYEGGQKVPVGISCCEAQGWSMARDLLSELSVALPSYPSQLAIITTHTYKGNPPGPDTPLNTGGLPVWVSEISPIMDRLGMTTTWYNSHAENEGLKWAINIHEALTTGNASAYIYWIGAGQSKSEAPFIWAPNRPERANLGFETYWWLDERVNFTESSDGTASGEPRYTIGSTYWASAHFSRFIRPGAKRVKHRQWTVPPEGGTSLDASDGAVLLSAYDNVDGTVVVQVINNSDFVVDEIVIELWDQNVRFGGDGKRDLGLEGGVYGSTVPVKRNRLEKRCEFETWVTDNDRRFVLVASAGSITRGGSFKGSLPARSLTTYVVRCVD